MALIRKCSICKKNSWKKVKGKGKVTAGPRTIHPQEQVLIKGLLDWRRTTPTRTVLVLMAISEWWGRLTVSTNVTKWLRISAVPPTAFAVWQFLGRLAVPRFSRLSQSAWRFSKSLNKFRNLILSKKSGPNVDPNPRPLEPESSVISLSHLIPRKWCAPYRFFPVSV